VALTDLVARQQRIWIDTELADWDTPNPRLSLIQLRLEDGSIHVVDVLSPEMAAAYQETFAPMVIAAPHIEKWAHYARFERRVFGPDVVRGLNCTFELARGLPYYHLPLRSLKLATLVHHLFGQAIDKSYQKADWGHRPLSAEELDYAAWDPEWCYRIHQGLESLAQSWDPATDDPVAIQRRYVDILPGLRDAKQWRAAIWDVVKALAFLIRTVPIRALAAAVAEVDPMRVAEFAVSVPSALLELLRPDGEAALREAGQKTVTSRFRGPRAPRERNKPTYDLDPEAPDRVATEFAAADHEHQKLESERQELKDRMRAWMECAKVNEWGEFEISDSSPRLRADVRIVSDWLRDGETPSTGLPGRFLLAFSPRQIAALSEYVAGALTPVMRWRPDRTAVPIEIAQSRDWHADDEGT
jgi:ribonuclease D